MGRNKILDEIKEEYDDKFDNAVASMRAQLQQDIRQQIRLEYEEEHEYDDEEDEEDDDDHIDDNIDEKQIQQTQPIQEPQQPQIDLTQMKMEEQYDTRLEAERKKIDEYYTNKENAFESEL